MNERVAIELNNGFVKLVDVTWGAQSTTFELAMSVVTFQRTDRKFENVWPVFEWRSEKMK